MGSHPFTGGSIETGKPVTNGKCGPASQGRKTMRPHDHQGTQERADTEAEMKLKDIVMGLRWDPREKGVTSGPDDLDALCVLFDERRCVLDVIHSGHPRNANNSVVHTGDSKTGAGEWDDERIFIFLEALPEAVSAFAFIVASFTARTFSDIRGA